MPLAPSNKGVHISLNEATSRFLESHLDELWKALALEDQGDGHTKNEQVMTNLVEDYGWVSTSDSFGKKAHVALMWKGDTELRVTVVLRKNTLRIDIREWYEPEK